MDNTDDFLIKYNKKIKPRLQKFEKQRRLQAFISIFCMFAALLLMISTVAFLDFFEEYLGNFWALAPIFAFIFLMFSGAVYSYFEINFVMKLKKDIMPVFCECMGNIQWAHAAQLFSNDTTLIIQSRLLPPETDISLEDTFTGITKNGSWYKISEVVLKSNKVFIFLKFKGKNYSNTILMPKDEFQYSYKLKQIYLEDVELDKIYNIYSDDEIEARYLLNPSLMEKISNLGKTYGGNRISLSFFGNNLVIKIATGNAFEIGGLFCSVNNDYPLFHVHDEIRVVQELAEYFEN